MVAKLAIYVCPVPGCVAISSQLISCPKHPNKSLMKEVYEHRPKLGAPKPGDLSGSKSVPFGGFDFSKADMGSILDGLFGKADKSS